MDDRAEIDRLFNQLPDAAIFAALPHAGTNLAPRLLLAFGKDRTRYQSAQGLRQSPNAVGKSAGCIGKPVLKEGFPP